MCNDTSFVLLDFNDETLQHTKEVLEDLKGKLNRQTKIEVVKNLSTKSSERKSRQACISKDTT